jgi:hypothetical protein
MNTLILYYSYSGHGKALAERLALEEQADLVAIKDRQRPGTLKAYSVGCLAALRGQGWAIQPLDVNWAAYDRVVVFAAVWAGNPAPAVNTALALLPPGKVVDLRMVSASGQSTCRERLRARIEALHCTLTDFTNVKAP